MYLFQTYNILYIKSAPLNKNNSFMTPNGQLFIKKLPRFIKNYIDHVYKKLQPQISGFLEIIETPARETR